MIETQGNKDYSIEVKKPQSRKEINWAQYLDVSRIVEVNEESVKLNEFVKAFNL